MSSKTPTRADIAKVYLEQKKSLREAAKILGLSYSGLRYWMDRYGFVYRNKSQAQLGNKNSMFGKFGSKHPRYGKTHSLNQKKKWSESKRGSQNPNWKGGRTKFIDCIRNLAEYKKWRKSCLIRDKHTCQQCHKQEGELNVDHIKPLVELVTVEQIANIEQAKNNKKLWDQRNGRTLCVRCHRKTESYGRQKRA